MKCMIFLGGDMGENEVFESDRFVICADSGYEHIKNTDIKCDVCVGDFDSADKNDIKCGKIFEYPKRKDYTDGEIAVMYALENGYDDIVIYGALGKRIDHELANIHLLRLIFKSGARGEIRSENTSVYYMEKAKMKLSGTVGDTVSLIPTDAPDAITLKGFEYPLSNQKLACTGVSNVMTENEAEIDIKSGSVIVVHIKTQKG